MNINNLTDGKLLVRNTVLNFVGLTVPILFGLVSIPILIKKLGTDRFGILTIIWMVIGYFSLFDMGLGRALIKIVSETIAIGKLTRIPSIVWTLLLFLLILGLGASTLVFILSPWLAGLFLKTPGLFRNEIQAGFRILAFAIPIVISTSALRGILEAYQRFGLVSIVHIINGIISFISPLIVAYFSLDLAVIVAVLAIGRLFIWLIYLLLCFYRIPSIRGKINIDFQLIPLMLRLGSWMTVSNIIGPVMVYFDRFIIGAWISLAAVAYYVTPFEMVTKLLIISGAVTSVLFPAFASSYKLNPIRTEVLFIKGLKVTLLTLFPIVCGIVIFAKSGLNLWLGNEFANNGKFVLQMLAVGVLINSLALSSFTLIQSLGRPDITAKLHIIELPIYLLLIWFVVPKYGINGLSIIWTVRVIMDAVVLTYIANRLLGNHKSDELIKIYAFLILGILILAPAVFPIGITMRIIMFLIVLTGYIACSWSFILKSDERAILLNLPRYVLGIVALK